MFSLNNIIWSTLMIAIVLMTSTEAYLNAAPAPQVHLHQQRLSQIKDITYLRNLERHAKSVEMENLMQSNINACENFYEYACGNWPKIYPANGKHTTTIDILLSAYNHKRLKILQDAIHKNDELSDIKIKNFFKSCLNLRNWNKNKYEMKLREIIDEFGQMPALLNDDADWQAENFDWLDTIARIQNIYGTNIIMEMGIITNVYNEHYNLIYVGEAQLRFETKSIYWGAATKLERDNYKLEIQQNLEKYLNIHTDLAIEIADEIFNFEKELAKGLSGKNLGSTLQSRLNPKNIDDIQNEYMPIIDIKRFLKTAFNHEINESIHIHQPKYMLNLMKVINETSAEQQANYIMYKLIEGFFHNGDEFISVRQAKCIETTETYFNELLDQMIFRKYIKENVRNEVEIIWESIKKTFRNKLEGDELEWISLTTRKTAIEKLSEMKLRFNDFSNRNFTELYLNLNISSDDFIENLKEVNKYQANNSIQVFLTNRKPIYNDIQKSYLIGYRPMINQIYVPILILQSNFLLSESYPQAIKFGTIGYLLAHEMLHGFDDTDLSFFDDESLDEFNERKECFKQQYSLFRYRGEYLPAMDIQAENIADNGGIQIAYLTYINWLKNHTEDSIENLKIFELLPTLNLTNHQLFFLSYGQFWCNDMSDDRQKLYLIDSHAPPMLRVFGVLRNFIEFSKSFKCKIGTEMNPKNKCKIY